MGTLRLFDPVGLHPPAGYSHVAVTNGPLVHVAGQVALDPDGQLVGPGDLGAQAERALTNVGIALEAAGASFASVASLTIFVAALVPHAELTKLRDPLRRRMGDVSPPTITLLYVHALMDPQWLVEVQATAVADTPAQEAAG